MLSVGVVVAHWSSNGGDARLSAVGAMSGPSDLNASFVWATRAVDSLLTQETAISIAYDSSVVAYTDLAQSNATMFPPIVVYALSTATGQSVWNATLPNALNHELNMDTLVCGSPSVFIAVTGTQSDPPSSAFVALASATGAVTWEVSHERAFSAYGCAGSSLVVLFLDGAVAIHDVATGKVTANFTSRRLAPVGAGALVLLQADNASEPTTAIVNNAEYTPDASQGMYAIDLVQQRVAWSALPGQILISIIASPDSAYVAAFVGSSATGTSGEGVYIIDAATGANITTLLFPNATHPSITNYEDKMALAWSPLPNGTGQHGTLFFAGLMGDFIPAPDVRWWGQILAWEIGEAGPSVQKLVGNLDLSVNATFHQDPLGDFEGPLIVGGMAVDATGDRVLVSFLPQGYTEIPPPNDDTPAVDLTLTTLAVATLDRAAGTINITSTFSWIVNGDDSPQFALGPADGQLIVANTSHILGFKA